MKPFVLALLLFLLPFAGYAGDLRERLDSLISAGNRAYLNGQMSELDTINARLNALSEESYILNAEEQRSYYASRMKLSGDYCYLRACAGESEYFDYAEYFFLRAQELDAQRFSTGAVVDLELAQLYYRQELYDRALMCLDAASGYYDGTGIYEPGDVEWNSVQMQRAITLARLGCFSEAVRLAEETVRTYKDKKSLDYARARRMQAKILGLAGGDVSKLCKAYRDFFETQRKYALENFAMMNSRQREEYWMMLRPFVSDAYALENADPEFLYDLTLFAKGLLLQLDTGLAEDQSPSGQQLESLTYTWKNIRSKLRPGEAAVEFVQYMPFHGGRPEMAALVLRHGDRPRWVRQPSPSLIDGRYGSAVDDGKRNTKDRMYLDSVLCTLVWTPELMEAIGGSRTVFFAPDGCYHNIAIEYIIPDGGPEARRLTSTRRLMERGSAARAFSSSDPMLLFGDIDYYTNPSKEGAADNDAEAFSIFLNYDFPLLGEETDESRKIARLRANPDDARQRGIFATEGAFRRLAPRFRSILVSTHGVSLSANIHLDYETDLKPAVRDGVLSSTVIGFTGVNACVQDAGYEASRFYDGLVSARELSHLDLSQCRLFTMSACQTGLGKVTADGVYGLQRGLKNAGVGAMILSLWSVHSDATARLMTALYGRLAKGESLHKAFRGAREDLMKGEVADGQAGLVETDCVYSFDPATLSGRAVPAKTAPYYNRPQYTDAFILIDALD